MTFQFISALIFLSWIQKIKTDCSQFCLSCEGIKNTCRLCDFSKGYFTSNGKCLLSLNKNCANFDLFGNCLTCPSNFALDPITKNCIEVPLYYQINFCYSYGSFNNCLACIPGYYMSMNACFAVQTPILNCDFYLTNKVCAVCSENYIFSSDYSYCVPIDKIKNCVNYSFLNCSSCLTGYVLNRNNYIFLLNTKIGQFSFLQQYFNTTSQIDWSSQNFCQKVLVENCLIVNSFNNCSVCKQGYYLNKNTSTCAKMPTISITGCQIYSAPFFCYMCSEGKFLLNSTTCSNVEKIENCASYDGKANETICLLCTFGFYVNKNSCIARFNSLSINNCRKSSLFADICIECDSGLIVSGDGLGCYPQIDDCQIYKNVTISASAMTCLTCSAGFYPNSINMAPNFCVQGNVSNCLIYNQLSKVCIQCQNAYYLNNDICVLHILISSCTVYSQTNPNSCLSCLPGNLPFKILASCVKITLIQGCLKYDDQITYRCVTCAQNYYLSVDKTNCKPIPANVTNCLSFIAANNSCIQCTNTTMLVQFLGICVKPFAYIIQNCKNINLTYALTDLSQFYPVCDICENNCISRRGNNDAICVETAYLSYRRYSLVDNCVRYSVDVPFKCLECSLGFYLNPKIGAQHSCVKNCSFSQALVLDNLDGFINVCIQMDNIQTFIGCTHLARIVISSKFSDNDYICVAIDLLNYFATMTNPTSVTNEMILMPFDSKTPRTKKFYHQGYLFTQLKVSNIAFRADPNCVLYYFFPLLNNYSCRKCTFGFTVQVDFTGVHKCVPIIPGDCVNSIIFTSYPSFIESVLTCYACSIANTQLRVPYIYINFDSITNLWTTLTVPTVSTLSIIQCDFNPATTGLGFIPNCGLYIRATDQNNIISVICGACSPGFYPTYNQLITWKINSCTIIQNCDFSANQDAVNRCRTCLQIVKTGIRLFTAFSDLSMTVCVTTRAKNCWIIGLNALCSICLPGYSLTLDKTCELLKIPECVSSISIPKMDFTDNSIMNNVLVYYLNSFYQFIGGCQNCSPGFTRVHLSPLENYCVISDYVTENDYILPTAYVPNCLSYFATGFNTAYLCSECLASFTPTDNYRSCVPNVQFCQFANTTNPYNCSTCQPDYINVGGSCIIPDITNCLIFGNSAAFNMSFCVKCNYGYYLLGSRFCFTGFVKNCYIYQNDSPNVCLQCEKGYMNVMIGSSGVSYCFLIKSNTNPCLTADSSIMGFQNLNLICQTCYQNLDSAYVVSQSFTMNSICMPYSEIPNCSLYQDTFLPIGLNSFSCLQCQEGYFFDQNLNKCTKRTMIDINCEKYSITANSCILCKIGYYLSSNGKECQMIARSIDFCVDFVNNSTCQTCITGYYLSNNVCFPVIIEIDNCLIYSWSNQCQQCISGYVLIGNTKCSWPIAQNCRTFASINACSSCWENNGLQQIDGIINCVSNFIPNCKKSSEIAPFVCLMCFCEFYTNLFGICLPVKELIKGCVIYSSESTCSQCDFGGVLSFDKKSCDFKTFVKKIDQNCSNITNTGFAFCSVCEPGYVFDKSGDCKPFPAKVINNGCFIGDFENSLDCISCLPGYVQNTTGFCNLMQTSSNFLILKSEGLSPANNFVKIMKDRLKLISLILFFGFQKK